MVKKNRTFPIWDLGFESFDAKDTEYGISGLHKAACFAAIYKTIPNSISRNVKPHQKVMHTALKEVNGNKPKIFSFLPEIS